MDHAREAVLQIEAVHGAGDGLVVGELGDEGPGRRELRGELVERLLVATAQDEVVVRGELVGDGAADPAVRPGDEHGRTGIAGGGLVLRKISHAPSLS